MNRISSSASDGVSYELESRSVVRYISIVTFLFWSSARATIHMKDRSTIVEPLCAVLPHVLFSEITAFVVLKRSSPIVIGCLFQRVVERK